MQEFSLLIKFDECFRNIFFTNTVVKLCLLNVLIDLIFLQLQVLLSNESFLGYQILKN